MRQIAHRLARWSESTLSLSALSRYCDHSLIAPVYHAVSDVPMPHIQSLYSYRSSREFARDIEFLCTQYKTVYRGGRLDDFMQGSSSDKVLLSFDDGLRQVMDPILPILDSHGLKALFFVNTDFVGNKALFYRYKASLLIDHLARIKLEKEHLRRLAQIFESEITGVDMLAEHLTKVSYRDRMRLDEAAGVLSYDFDDFLRTYQPYMDWNDLRRLQKEGHLIGAHSCDHPLYGQLSLQEQLKQSQESIDSVRRQLDPEETLFAFPFTDDGVSPEFYERMRIDYPDLWLFGTAGLKKDREARSVQRIPIELYEGDCESVLRMEMLYYLMRKPFGKNWVRRT